MKGFMGTLHLIPFFCFFMRWFVAFNHFRVQDGDREKLVLWFSGGDKKIKSLKLNSSCLGFFGVFLVFGNK